MPLNRRLGCLLCAAALLVSLYLTYPLVVLDGIGGIIFPLISRTDTEYALGFSHRAFLKISPGMTPMEVEQQLGPPIKKYVVRKTGETGWKYSQTPSDASYRIRIVFFRDGRVSERLSEFYSD